jgi:hypothetical protein
MERMANEWGGGLYSDNADGCWPYSFLLLTPATLRRWQQGSKSIELAGLPTHFGYLDLTIEPRPDGSQLDYRFKLAPKGDQLSRELQKIITNARAPYGRKIARVTLNGQSYVTLTSNCTHGICSGCVKRRKNPQHDTVAV